MFPKTVIFHCLNQVFEVHQRDIAEPVYMIFDVKDLFTHTYNGKQVKRLYILERSLSKRAREFVKSVLTKPHIDFQEVLMALKDMGTEYVVLVEGGFAFYESTNFSSSEAERTVGEPKSILAVEVGNSYTIRAMLANSIEYNMRKGKTFKEAVLALGEAGVFGDYIINEVNLDV